MLKYCLNRYETQEMRDKAFNAFLPALNFVPDWFVTKKNIIEKLDDTLFANHTIIFMNVDSNNVTFFGGEMGNFSVDLVIKLILMMLILMTIILKLLPCHCYVLI